ncbi:GNAT family N-acetyltransferase [Hahella aquimaris]|uniref:tRNA(Met) cytidine acetyltransferase TmcA n=1 Tax=Hahella sp. HNIBRBA332 TaxID=3015983 RepID=UPI00273AEFC4|nr:GNAT family N-acetyltransferase [Hahella sp. HNIBRBA332]WLQ11477.1 GNAT family N-acetyltransferase [Hahella sp. HNIBRBA332]
MSQEENWRDALASALARARAANFRAPVLIQGDAPEIDAALWPALELLTPNQQIVWVGAPASPPPTLQTKLEVLEAARFQIRLGQEIDCLIFDARSGFHADAFAALTGTVRGGGVLLLLTPPAQQWPSFDDPDYQRILAHPFTHQDVDGHYLRHLQKHLDNASGWLRVTFAGNAKPIIRYTASNTPSNAVAHTGSVSQSAVITALRALIAGQHDALAITADRGRGKSASLGIAAAHRIAERAECVLVTAPSFAAVATLFKHAEMTATELGLDQERLKQHLIFIAPDDLLQRLPTADIVLIDEAAAIPTPILASLLEHYPSVVFATTLHGYEGTGQGFPLRVFPLLDKRRPGWRHVTMSQPMRWSQGDPLETFINDALLLNQYQPAPLPTAWDESELNFERLDGESLLRSPQRLSEIFQLLTLAHYRTTPDDLRTLLDSPGLDVFVSTVRGRVLGAVLLSHERPFTEPQLIDAIWRGTRRPRGHLLQQLFAQQMSVREALQRPMARVIRIAVHPKRQGRGVGLWMLQALKRTLEQTDCCLIGASFGASDALLQFWEQAGYRLLRLGGKRDHVAGAYAACVAMSLKSEGEALISQAHDRLVRRSAFDSHHVFAREPWILSRLPTQTQEALQAREIELLQLFVEGSRPYENVEDLLLILCAQTGLTHLEEKAAALWRAKVQQQQDWSEVARLTRLSGRKQITAQLRECARALLTSLETAGAPAG